MSHLLSPRQRGSLGGVSNGAGWRARQASAGVPPLDHEPAYPLVIGGRPRATCRCHWMAVASRG
jgi:hypothetical protein